MKGAAFISRPFCYLLKSVNKMPFSTILGSVADEDLKALSASIMRFKAFKKFLEGGNIRAELTRRFPNTSGLRPVRFQPGPYLLRTGV